MDEPAVKAALSLIGDATVAQVMGNVSVVAPEIVLKLVGFTVMTLKI
jgi:hypothetical protein